MTSSSFLLPASSANASPAQPRDPTSGKRVAQEPASPRGHSIATCIRGSRRAPELLGCAGMKLALVLVLVLGAIGGAIAVIVIPDARSAAPSEPAVKPA